MTGAAAQTLEVPLDSLEAARHAAPYASRLELCHDLPSEGWSPSGEFIRQVRDLTDGSIVAMIRPRLPGSAPTLCVSSFVATPRVMSESTREIELAARAGANSVAIGLLTPDGFVDVDACAELARVARAAKLDVAFLRTFDLLTDRARGMRDITALTMTRVITAGVLGWDASVASLDARVAVLTEDILNARSCARAGTAPVEVVACGGVRTDNAHEFLRVTPHLHASCRVGGSFSADEVQTLHARLTCPTSSCSTRRSTVGS